MILRSYPHADGTAVTFGVNNNYNLHDSTTYMTAQPTWQRDLHASATYKTARSTWQRNLHDSATYTWQRDLHDSTIYMTAQTPAKRFSLCISKSSSSYASPIYPHWIALSLLCSITQTRSLSLSPRIPVSSKRMSSTIPLSLDGLYNPLLKITATKWQRSSNGK